MVADSLLASFGAVIGRDMAVDLGTANTLVYVRGEGIVLDEPSVVAINTNDGRPLAVGLEAKRMIGRTPSNIQAIRPLKDGVIADFEICEKMLRYFIQKVHQRKWAKPRMVIAVPSGITGVEQRAVQEAAEFAGARKPAYIIEEPMAWGPPPRRRSPGPAPDRQHDRRHRWWHHRSRGDLARRRGCQPIGASRWR
jgi:rod shape-determining protein MreB